MAKRIFDIVLVIVLLPLLLIPFLVAALAVRLTSSGPVIYWSRRIGRNGDEFMMPKFRTMRTDTPSVATHLLKNTESYLTPVGSLLRRTSLDELPQLWSIAVGDMSFVGPRPALYNQDDLIEQRARAGVDKLLPGLTGWAQVNGRDELAVPDKVNLDIEYMQRQSLAFDLRIILFTFVNVLLSRDISH